MLAVETQTGQKDGGQKVFVELSFGVIGRTLPADHGYGLYSAIAHQCPSIHEQAGVSIATIPGEPDRRGKILLSRNSQLKIRLPYVADTIALVLPLAGQTLKIGQHSIQLNIPQIFPLRPYEKLRSRIVTIKKFQEPEPFLEAVNRQMNTLGIQGNAFVPQDETGQPLRKAIKIKSYSVVGFSLIVTDLSEEDSIKLQACGLGGKHRMGCGIFTAFPRVWRFQDV
ncbi:type I-MYXAN CRISPR-associated protein Cas6/Cmx6 [Lyngbya confervoides]|uniref:Type I-MYXAN CRISPR-associated protein Cas6/Cmx6 n=1 Tax=Lyngbya confervoides BDU141951 TaxID=1574623 RepID=A0ABD4T595_9CYAN|nr:type I-MYXAN CRISPR-associated protein Cas6/Cmx6 [Lyngbya confervoides]MCM1983961.1 type I-MYXAN CRISPR-associated protein Cas6/Cmx6 [Lyngbya confervoides BDU141951]